MGLAALGYCREIVKAQARLWTAIVLGLFFLASTILSPRSDLSKGLLILFSASVVVQCFRFWRRVVPLRVRLGWSPGAPVWLVLLTPLSVAVLSAQLLDAFVVSPTVVSGTSMTPTLRSGDLTLLWRGAYGVASPFGHGYLFPGAGPQRGDVITFTYRDKVALTKRVIGIPGDTVEVNRDLVKVNGTVLRQGEPRPAQLSPLPDTGSIELTPASRFVTEALGNRHYEVLERPGHAAVVAPHPRAFARRERFPCSFEQEVLRCVVPACQVFVLGDNRPVSADSRMLGLMLFDEIDGKSVMRLHWQGAAPLLSRL